MKFTTLIQLRNYITKHHYLFAGVPWQDEWLNILSTTLKATAVAGATFEAWQDVPDYGDLKTYIAIKKHPDGYYIYNESADLDIITAIMDY